MTDLNELDYDQIVERQGWDLQTQVDYLREYIANQHCDEALDDFARVKALEDGPIGMQEG